VIDPLSFVAGSVFGAVLAWGLVWRTARETRRRLTRGRINHLLDRMW